MSETPVCPMCWGSHGCSRLQGHAGPHLCGAADDPCSEHDGTSRVRYMMFDGDDTPVGWSEWVDSAPPFSYLSP